MERNNIILIGMPTAGKSTAGVILAKILGMDFVDTDLLLQRHAGRKLKDIMEAEGLAGFLRMEEEVCLSFASDNTVVATGGSVVYGEKAMAHLKALGTVVYLHIDYDTLMRRLHNAKQRGVVLKDGQTIEELYRERIVLYELYADITVKEDGHSLEDVVASLAARFAEGRE
ncbi:MAG: shikimate kinase [Lachnospiraceae bacterium]|nr:shikimate kinase [Lachnospiraceae bacterium]